MALQGQLIELYKGEAKTLRLTATTATAIGGWTIVFTVRPYFNSPILTFTKSGSAIAITDANNGVFTVAVTAADTTLTPGEYAWDAWRTDAGFETLVALGQLNILGETRV